MVDLSKKTQSTNPFEAPEAAPDTGAPSFDDDSASRPLAERGTRLAGAFIDGSLFLAAAVPGAIVFGFSGAMSGFGDDPFGSTGSTLAIAVMFLGVFALAIYQWILTATTGQTLAKKWLKMKIVKVNGAPVDFVSGVILRSWIIQALGMIPMVGSFVALADAVTIFGDQRRCLHDYIAGTIVIDVTD